MGCMLWIVSHTTQYSVTALQAQSSCAVAVTDLPCKAEHHTVRSGNLLAGLDRNTACGQIWSVGQSCIVRQGLQEQLDAPPLCSTLAKSPARTDMLQLISSKHFSACYRLVHQACLTTIAGGNRCKTQQDLLGVQDRQGTRVCLVLHHTSFCNYRMPWCVS